MKPVSLIAVNFLRENRWAVILLMIWGVGSGFAAALTIRSSTDDALFFLKQQAAYSVFFTVFLAASALYNQRRSRRILSVLSKGIERHEYLAGIVLGFTIVSLCYSIIFAISGACTFALAGVNPVAILPLALTLLIASVLAGTVALFFSTFMNPLFTLASTSLLVGASAVFARDIAFALPAYSLLESTMGFNLHQTATHPWVAASWGVIEIVLLWVAASVVFARRDIAVSVE